MFTLVLLISEEKRPESRLAYPIENVPIFTSGIITYPSVAKESKQTGCEIGTFSVGYARRRSERFSSDIKRTRINNYSSKSTFCRYAVVMKTSAS